MTTDERTRPADMSVAELDAALAKLTEARREAPTATRKLVISSILDRLLDERYSRHVKDEADPTSAPTHATSATDTQPAAPTPSASHPTPPR
jgi:hypothetical protein